MEIHTGGDIFSVVNHAGRPLTGSLIGNKSATTCRPGEVLCMFDMGQMNSGG